jgi:hypothetical protein
MVRRAFTRRERLLITLATVILFSIVILPAGRVLARKYRETHSELDAAVHRLSEARDLRRAILEQRKGSELIAQRVSAGSGDFDLYNFASSVIDQLGLKEAAQFRSLVAPARLNLISIELEGIGLDDLVRLMHALQHGDHLVALELLYNLEAAKDNKGLNCSITLSSPRA